MVEPGTETANITQNNILPDVILYTAMYYDDRLSYVYAVMYTYDRYMYIYTHIHTHDSTYIYIYIYSILPCVYILGALLAAAGVAVPGTSARHART